MHMCPHLGGGMKHRYHWMWQIFSFHSSYLSEWYWWAVESLRAIVTTFPKTQFFILPLGEILQAAWVRVVQYMPFDGIWTSPKSRGAFKEISSLLMKRWFSFGVSRLFSSRNDNSMPTFGEFVRFRKFDRYAMKEPKRVSYKYGGTMTN